MSILLNLGGKKKSFWVTYVDHWKQTEILYSGILNRAVLPSVFEMSNVLNSLSHEEIYSVWNHTV